MAPDGLDCANGLGGAREHRKSNAADRDAACQAAKGRVVRRKEQNDNVARDVGKL